MLGQFNALVSYTELYDGLTIGGNDNLRQLLTMHILCFIIAFFIYHADYHVLYSFANWLGHPIFNAIRDCWYRHLDNLKKHTLVELIMILLVKYRVVLFNIPEKQSHTLGS